jgi:hypothetical protein
MDEKEELKFAQASLNSVLFFVPQIARNAIELLRRARGAVLESSPAEVRVLFNQQEFWLKKLCSTFDLMHMDVWDLAQERFQELAVDCEMARAELDCAISAQFDEEFRRRVPNDQQMLARMIGENGKSKTPEGEHQNGKKK